MKSSLILLAILLSVTALPADIMVVGGKTYTGTLEGFKNNSFIFKINYKKTLKKPRTNVKKVILDKPYNVIYTEKGITHSTKLVKYENSKFFFKSKQEGKKEIYGGKIKDLEIEKRSMFATQASKPNDQDLKTTLNLKELTTSRNLSNSQKIAINNYIKRRKSYIQFQKESSVMVKQRDQANGKKREELINQLQLRKNAEQPLKNELRASVRQLDSLF